MVRLPPPYFFDSEVPLVFYDNRIYRPTQKPKEDFIQFLDRKHNLTSIGTFEELEKIYFENYSDIIFQFKKDFLENKVSHHLVETNKVSNQLRENKILSFIIKDVMPALRENPDYRSNRRIRSEISSVAPATRITREIKNRLIGQIEREHTGDSYFNKPNKEILLGKRLYELKRNCDSSVQVRIGNTKLGLLKSAIDFPGSYQFQAASHASTNYLSNLAKKLKIQAVQKDLENTNKLAQISKERQKLEAILRANNYEESGAGFKKSESGYYVFVELPEYVLLSPHNGHLYRFTPLKVGVELTCSNRGRIQVGRPVALDSRYTHPFLPNYGGTRYICLGRYGYDRVQRAQPLDAILQFLYDTRNIMMHSYSRGRNPHNRLDDSRFRSKRISPEEVRRRNLPIANQALVEQHRGQATRGDNYDEWR